MTSEHLEDLRQFIRPFGWIVNMEHHIIVCTTCNKLLDPRSPHNHLRSCGHAKGRPTVSLHEFQEFSPHFTHFVSEPQHPAALIDLIPGLLVTPPMQVCLSCNRGYKIPSDGDPSKLHGSFRSHVCHRSRSTDPQFAIFPCQRFGPSSSYFPVRETPNPPPSDDTWQTYKKWMTADADKPKGSNPHDDRAMAGFLRNRGWVEHVEELNPTALGSFYRIGPGDDPFRSLPLRIHAFLAKMQSSIQTHALQRIIGRRPGSERDQQIERHHRSVRYETHQKYANWMAEALCLLLRRVSQEREPYMNFPVPPAILDKATSLASALSQPVQPEDNEDDTSDPGFNEDQNSDDEQEEDDDAPEDLDHDISRPPPQGVDNLEPRQIKPYGPLEYKTAPSYDDPIQSMVVELLSALYTDVTLGSTDDGFRSVLVRYLVISSIKPSGQWRIPSDITPKIAGILFTGRVTFGRLLLAKRATSPSLTYDQ
jgi:hypothetical protein